MITWVEKRNDFAYLYTNSDNGTGLVGGGTLFSLIVNQGATEEVEEYLREECGWHHL